MNKLGFLASAILCSSLSLSAFTLGNLGDFKFVKQPTGVFVMHGPVMEPNKENEGFMNNPAIIESKNGLIMVDPGGNYNVGKKIMAEVDEVSKKPVIAVLNTHKHGDHWFANKAIVERYPDVKIYAHKHMIEEAKAGEAELWYNILEMLSGNLKGTKPFAYPIIELQDKQKIEIDGEEFVIYYPGAGHTDTDIHIEHKNSGTLFVGDNIIHQRYGQFDDSSSILANIEVLEDIKAKKYGNYKFIVPGHGPSGATDAEVIDPFLNYMKILRDTAQEAYDNDMEAYEIKEELDKRLKAYHHWDAYDTVVGKHLQKVYEEIEANDME
ncbi:MAG: MBL fold metallo-hydrolase [Sulfurimonas sp.]|nr:MBL fold metallo-hydrolase [Sulfurimonadaceae bacterium]